MWMDMHNVTHGPQLKVLYLMRSYSCLKPISAWDYIFMKK